MARAIFVPVQIAFMVLVTIAATVMMRHDQGPEEARTFLALMILIGWPICIRLMLFVRDHMDGPSIGI